MADCIFCKIASGDIPAAQVYEDEQTLCFMDAFPATRGHVLVISREHSENLLKISDEALVAVARTSQRIARAQMLALQPDGLRMMQFNGAEAGQSVFHYHVHLRPVYKGQNQRSHGRDQASSQELQALADQIRAALL